MKCVICNSEDIIKKTVNEEVKSGDDIFLFPLEVLVCNSCGERYYDRTTMAKLEDARQKIREKRIKFYKVGEIYKT
jgi:YgiT-type zinc finger domain-containing protein